MEISSMNNHQQQDTVGQIKEFWTTIVLHRWGILLVTAILTAVSIVVIALLPDSYTASTTVLFDPQKLPERYVAPTVTTDPAQRVNTLTQEVLGVGRLQQIVRDLHLNDAAGMSVQDFVDQMRKGITIEMKPNSEHDMNAFVITYSGQDPQMVAAVANKLAQSFIDWDLANREQQAASTTEFMTAQLRDAKQTLDEEEGKINDYKLKHPGELPEQMQSNMQALATLHTTLQSNNEAIDRLEQEKTMLTSVPEASRPLPANPSERDRLESERRTLQTELTQLRAQFTDQYPDVVSTRNRLEAVTKQINKLDPATSITAASQAAVRLQIIAQETERLQQEQQKLIQRINRYQAQVDATPLRGQEIEFLSRNYSNARDQYQSLLDQKFHAEMAMDLERQQKTSRFTVDPAQVPERPVKPNRLLLLALMLPVCILIPSAIAVAGAEFKGTVNSEQTLRSLLPEATRVVGSIPMIQTPGDMRKRRRLAMLSLLGSFTCCIIVAVFLWGGTASRIRHARAQRFTPSTTPTAKLLPR
jgi:polysaccharide biosynthesis transport protein